MVKGLYTAYTGMINQEHRMDVLTNNLANADTNGYKKEGATAQSFDSILAYKIKDNSEGYRLAKRTGVHNPGVKITFLARGNLAINCVHTDSNSAAFTSPFVAVTSKPSGLIPNTFSASSSLPRITSQPATNAGITSEAVFPYFHRFLR